MNAPLIQPRLFSVDEFERMRAKQVFSTDERLELIEGCIYGGPIASDQENACVKRLDHALGDETASRVLTSVHDPLRMPHSQLQPDLLLLKPRADNYFSGHPSAAEALLVIEIGETTVDFDRQVKIPLYGRNGALETWLVDLLAVAIEVYRQPNPAGYSDRQIFRPGDSLVPTALPDIRLDVAEILGTHT